MTVSGYTCQKWTEQLPYEHIYTMDKFNEKGIGDHNYCWHGTRGREYFVVRIL